jgi:hypothetical protein
MLEAHELGGGTPGGRNACEIRDAGRAIVDEYDAVLPSSLAPGPHTLMLGTVELGTASVTLRSSLAAPFDVE